MQKYNKSTNALTFNIFIALNLLIASFVCFLNIKRTVVNLGIDLYLIFALTLFAFAIPFIFNIIRYFLLPTTLITIENQEISIYQRKKTINIKVTDLVSISKLNNFGERFGFDVGSLKLIVRNERKPIYVRFLEGINGAYEALSVFVFSNAEAIVKNIRR